MGKLPNSWAGQGQTYESAWGKLRNSWAGYGQI